MLALALTSLIASAPETTQPAPLRQLTERLSRPGRVAVVKVTASDPRCVVHAVAVPDAVVDAAAAAGVATALSGQARGLDLRRRACVSAAVVDVSYRAVVDVAYGRGVVVRVAAAGFEVDADGVLVPCGKADVDAGRVCARVGNNVVRGALVEGVLWVQP